MTDHKGHTQSHNDKRNLLWWMTSTRYEFVNAYLCGSRSMRICKMCVSVCNCPNERNANWQYVITSASNMGEMKGAAMAVISKRNFISFKIKMMLNLKNILQIYKYICIENWLACALSSIVWNVPFIPKQINSIIRRNEKEQK